MCKLAKDVLESKTGVQLPNPSYSPDLSHCHIFLFTLLKNSRSRYESQRAFGSDIVQCLHSVSIQVNLSCFRA